MSIKLDTTSELTKEEKVARDVYITLDEVYKHENNIPCYLRESY